MSENMDSALEPGQTATPASPKEPTEAPNAIDPSLIEKLGNLRMFTRLDSLLENCLFPGGAAAEILGAKQFLQKLHAPLFKECQSHPDFARATNPPAAAPVLKPEDIKAKAQADEKRKRKEAKAKRQRAN